MELYLRWYHWSLLTRVGRVQTPSGVVKLIPYGMVMEYSMRAMANPKRKQVFKEELEGGGDAGSNPVKGSFKSL